MSDEEKRAAAQDTEEELKEAIETPVETVGADSAEPGSEAGEDVEETEDAVEELADGAEAAKDAAEEVEGAADDLVDAIDDTGETDEHEAADEAAAEADGPDIFDTADATDETTDETDELAGAVDEADETLAADETILGSDEDSRAGETSISAEELGILEAELKKEKHRSSYLRALRSTIFSLIVVAAAAVIVAMLVLPVLQIQGTSMTETLQDKDIVIALRGSGYETGDVIAFYYNNNILIKRVIASAGQWVDISEDGTVYVNNVRLDEPYVSEPSIGDCNITLPYQVPEGKIFVMGDHRSTSLDSRNTALGCISEDMVVGRLLLRAWPITGFGPVS